MRRLSLAVWVVLSLHAGWCGEAAAQPKTEGDRLYNSALAKQKKGDANGAIGDFSKAIAFNPKDSDAYLGRGVVRRDQGDLRGAIADSKKAIEISPKDAGAYVYCAAAQQMNGDLRQAIGNYTKAIALDPKQTEAYYNRGVAWEAKDDLDRAIADFTSAIALNGKHSGAYANRGISWERKGDYARAGADATKALALDPKNAKSYINRGTAYAEQQKWGQAYRQFDAGVQVDHRALYAALLRYTAEVHLTPEAAAKVQLQGALRQRRPAGTKDWSTQLGERLLGKITEAELVAAAETKDRETTRGQQCEAWYYAGVARLADGQEKEAKACFRRSVATKHKNFSEYWLARAELAQR